MPLLVTQDVFIKDWLARWGASPQPLCLHTIPGPSRWTLLRATLDTLQQAKAGPVALFIRRPLWSAALANLEGEVKDENSQPNTPSGKIQPPWESPQHFHASSIHLQDALASRGSLSTPALSSCFLSAVIDIGSGKLSRSCAQRAWHFLQ